MKSDYCCSIIATKYNVLVSCMRGKMMQINTRLVSTFSIMW